MRAALVIAGQEFRVGLRNRWIVAMTLLLAALALSLTLLGSVPTGTVGVDPLAVVVVSLSSLTIFLVPLIALMLSFDAVVGEEERGTLMLLLAYPVARWEVVVGKFLGHAAILAVATIAGYGCAGAALLLRDGLGGAGGAAAGWPAFGAMVGSSILLGAAFLALGGLASVLVRERATAAGIAVAVWLVFVLLYDTALLGILVADQGRIVGADLLDVLLLLNPTDAYRLLNLTSSESTRAYAGMAGPGESGLAPGVLVAALVAWVAVPLAAATAIFSRRQL
ncbi:MAG: ABC transporter permease subunit [Kiloniellaceae bacterium]